MKWSQRVCFWSVFLIFFLGIGVANTAEAQTWLGFTMGSGGKGVRVLKVFKGSPASVAGLKRGDMVVHVDGKEVKSPGQVLRAYSGKGVGKKLAVVYWRGSRKQRVYLKLTKRPSLEKLLKLMLTGERAKSFRAKKMGGGHVSLASLKGKVVLVEFWATWCKSCILSLNKLKKGYGTLRRRGFRVVALARNSLSDTAKKARSLRLPFLVGADPGARIARAYHLAKVPSLVLIDRKGVIRDIWLGSSYDLNRVKRKIKSLLRESP